MKSWLTPLFGLTEEPVVAMVGTKAVTLVPKGTIRAIVWLPSFTTPMTPGDSALKLNAVMALVELEATVTVTV